MTSTDYKWYPAIHISIPDTIGIIGINPNQIANNNTIKKSSTIQKIGTKTNFIHKI